MASRSEEIIADIKGVGVSEHDAMVLADCIITRKSCSWVNTDEVNEKMIEDLRHLIRKKEYGISVKVDAVPTRSKFIWDVKVE